MKKFIYWVMALCLIISLAGCAKETSPGESEPPVAVTNEVTPTPEATPAPEVRDEQDTLIDTEYYTIKIPESWRENCIYEVNKGENNDYSLSFYDKANYGESGGWLFSVVLLTEQDDYTYYPSYELLGSIDTQEAGAFNAIVIYPTDVQFSDEAASEYNEMFDAVPDVLKTISFKENCSFSETPVEVQSAMQQP